MSVYYFYDSNSVVPFFYFTASRSSGVLPPPYSASKWPNEYLAYAIDDFAEGSERGLVNAFGNAKRALHLAIDIVLQQYGLFKHYGKANFPTKLELLDDVGILPTNIIKNLNVERNLIEHEYDTPPQKRVEEAIDVVKLLLLALDKLLEQTPHEAVVGWKSPKRHLVMQLEPLQGIINFFTLKAKGKYKLRDGINYFNEPLRLFGGELLPGVEVSSQPWKQILLNKANMAEWKPILAELVNIQRKRSSTGTVLNLQDATATIPITIPLPIPTGKTWNEIIDGILLERLKINKPSENGGSNEEPTTA